MTVNTQNANLPGYDSNGLEIQVPHSLDSNGDPQAVSSSNPLPNKDAPASTTTLATHTSATTGNWHTCTSKDLSVHVASNGSHAGTTSITIEVTNDETLDPLALTYILSVTGASDSAGFSIPNRWTKVRSDCTSFGSAGSVSVVIGE